MKLNINPATLFNKKEGARICSTLFKAKWEVGLVKLSALLKETISMKLFPVSFSKAILSRFCE